MALGAGRRLAFGWGLPGAPDAGINPNQLASALALYAAPCLAVGVGWLLGAAVALLGLLVTQSCWGCAR